MADKNINLLIPLAFVNRCPDPVQLQKLREAAIRFCQETEVWTDFEDITTTATRDQTIAAPHAGGYIYRVARVTDVQDLAAETEQEIEINRHTYQADQTHTTLRFNAAPEADLTYRVHYIMVPILVHTVLPDWLIDRWGQVIADGALSAIRLDIGNAKDPNPWADPTQAAIHNQRFLEGVGRARQQIVSDNEGGDTLVEIPVY